MGHLQKYIFLLFSGIFLATKVQGTWYDYGFAETSGKVSQDGTLLKSLMEHRCLTYPLALNVQPSP